jgi:outer membrane protein assembly factor BamD (BamD/ComL family)
MIAICHKCGTTKAAPIQRCGSCGGVPVNDDELALAFMLTDRFLPKEKLAEASRLLKSGQSITLPPQIRTAIQASIQAARAQQSTRSQGITLGLRGWAVVVGAISLLFLIFHPWPHYQWASLRDRVPTYEGFVKRFPSSDLADNAREQIRLLREDDVWGEANGSEDITALRSYRKAYPDGKHLSAANGQIQKLSDNYWDNISKTDSRATVLDFLRDYPETSKKADAEARVVAIADAKWETISKTSSKNEVLKFLNAYPETTKTTEAEARIVTIADAQWAKISMSRSVPAINAFLADYPETSMRHAAEQRVQQLYDDWDWVREQDTLAHFQRFVARHPDHPERAWIDKRIIDLEVKEIAAGEYGELPPAQPLRIGGATATVEVDNQTGYELTVRYSGPDSKKLIIPKGATQSVSLPPGDYQVAASVSAANVRNYYGKDTMRGGQYSSSFYIQTDYGGFSLPRYTPNRGR